MDWTVTIPAALVAALDKRAGVADDAADKDAIRSRWLVQSLRNELRQEREAMKSERSDALLVKLAALPAKARRDLEAAIGQSIPEVTR